MPFISRFWLLPPPLLFHAIPLFVAVRVGSVFGVCRRAIKSCIEDILQFVVVVAFVVRFVYSFAHSFN